MRKHFILMISIGMGVLFWIGDALLDVLVFKKSTLFAELFAPSAHETAMRLFGAAMLAGLSMILRRADAKEKQTASLINAEKSRSESILDAVGDAVSIQDLDYRVLYQNRAHRELMGDHRGDFCYQAYEASDATCEGCPVALVFADGGVHTSERTVAIGRSGVRYFEITASPLRDSSGGIIAGIEVVREITSRKQTETALRESAEKFRTLFEESKDVFYISTTDGKFLDINPAGVELFGYSSKEELLAVDIGRDLYVNRHDREQFVEIVGQTNYAKDYEVEMKRKKGDKLRVIITSTALRDGEGKVWGFRGVIRDVTEQKKLEQQLLQSQKMEAIGLLAGGIAHDFNNILTAILGYGNLLLKQVKGNDKQRSYAEHVLESAERASRLTKSILAFSRKQVLHPEPVDLNAVIGRVEKFLVHLIGEDIALKAVLQGADMTVMADSVQLEQVLINLATNARDAMPSGGSLVIETSVEKLDGEHATAYGLRTPGNYAVIAVTDTGAGFDEETRERIFEPFFTTKDAGQGTGLGLSIAYGIINQHGGQIQVESEPGKGSRFRIYLPLITQRPGGRDHTVAASPAGGTETILLAEDDPMVRSLARHTLEEAGYTVVEAATGEEAVTGFAAAPDRIQLLVLDVVMPHKNGKEAFNEARKIRPGVKALFISGYTGEIIHKKGILHVGLDFIPKPVSPAELLFKVREVLDRKN